MTPERAVELVARWVRFYTRDLPTPTAQRRVNEIRADLHDHLAYERDRGTSDRRIALSILSRMARRMTADTSWRRRVRSLNGDPMKLLIAVLISVVIAALGIAFAIYAGYDDSPGGVLLGMLLVVGAVVLAIRAIRTRRRPAGSGSAKLNRCSDAGEAHAARQRRPRRCRRRPGRR